MIQIDLCQNESCWCLPEAASTKITVALNAKTVDSIVNAMMTPAIFWEVVEACRNTVTPHPRRTNLNATDAPTRISVPVSFHP